MRLALGNQAREMHGVWVIQGLFDHSRGLVPETAALAADAIAFAGMGTPIDPEAILATKKI